MGILDSVLGTATQTQTAGGGTEQLIQSVIGMLTNRQSGGLGGLVNAFQSQGLGHIISSWIGTGNNQPISPDQVHQVLGQERIQQMSNESGMPVNDVKSKLATLLPQLVDRATPNGQIPQGGIQHGGLLEHGLELLKGRM